MSDYGKGPWTAGKTEVEGSCEEAIDIRDANGDAIAAVWDRTIEDEPLPESEGVARLIAAAPELLDVLRRFLAATYDTAEYDEVEEDAAALIDRIEAPSQGGTGRGT